MGQLKKFQPKELTVGEVRAWEQALTSADFDGVDELLIAECSLADIVLMSNYSKADLDELKPSELKTLVVKIKEVNPDFFAMRETLLTLSATRELMAATPAKD